jgi:hypothetical protein
MADIGANGFHRVHAGGEKVSVSRSAVTEIGDYSILLRDIQLTHVQRSEVQLWKRYFHTKNFTLNEANTFVALPNA